MLTEGDAEDELVDDELSAELDPDRPQAAGDGDRLVPYFRATPWIMGILNVTPDSFSDGGRWETTDPAVARGLQLVADGAQLVDVGGESTRPGAHRVDAEEETARVVPVIEQLAAAGVQCSVDTTRASVAAAALDAGAVLVNDVSGGLADPEMVDLVAQRRCSWVLMHWRGHSARMDTLARYDDVVRDVRAELSGQVEAALARGVDERSLILDPGLGFAKTAAHNWELLHRIDELVGLGLPVLVGASRKRFLGQLLARGETDQLELPLDRPVFDPGGVPRAAAGREFATAAISALMARAGVWAVRVHEPGPSADVLAVEATMRSLRTRHSATAGVVPPMIPDRPLGRVYRGEDLPFAPGDSWYPGGSWHPATGPDQDAVPASRERGRDG